MIKVLNCKNKNYLRKLIDFLDKRRLGKTADTSIVTKILKDIKKNNPLKIFKSNVFLGLILTLSSLGNHVS